MEVNEKFDKNNFFLIILNQELELSMQSISFFELQIKIRKYKIRNLKKVKTFWFQKRKRGDILEEIKNYEQEIDYYYKELNHELKNIYRIDIMKRNLNNERII